VTGSGIGRYFLIIVGAILTFVLQVTVAGVDLRGRLILMLAGGRSGLFFYF
jgi:hypothetical protein